MTSCCSVDHLTYWAEREATPVEYSQLDSEGFEMRDEDESLWEVHSPLKKALMREVIR
jgi:hypothetical protein